MLQVILMAVVGGMLVFYSECLMFVPVSIGQLARPVEHIR